MKVKIFIEFFIQIFMVEVRLSYIEIDGRNKYRTVIIESPGIRDEKTMKRPDDDYRALFRYLNTLRNESVQLVIDSKDIPSRKKVALTELVLIHNSSIDNNNQGINS